MYIPIILGTARIGRQSEKVSNFMLAEAIKNNLESDIIDVQDYAIKATDNTQSSGKAKDLYKKIVKADGFIIVSPEYNHSFPGELKLLLDMFFKEYAKKPVGFCGVSAGNLGGSRAVEQLRLISIEFSMVPIREALCFSQVHNLFDDKGAIKDAAYYSRVKIFFDELLWYAKYLKASRDV